MALFSRIDLTFTDLLGNVVVGGTVEFFDVGAQVNGNQTGTVITVHDAGRIAAGNTVQINGAGTSYVISAATETTVTFPSSVTVVNKDRLVRVLPLATVYTDPKGATAAGALTTDSNGRVTVYGDGRPFDARCSGGTAGGVTFGTALIYDFLPGGQRHKSPVRSSATAQAHRFDTVEDLTAGQLVVFARNGADKSHVDYRGWLMNSNNVHYHNVLSPEFGAVGSGVTDDLAAIQEAIDLIKGGTPGGIVYLPALDTTTRYGISGRINIDDNGVTLLGSGKNATQIDALGSFPTGTALISLGKNGGVFGSQIRDLAIDCKSVVNSVGILMNGAQEGSGVLDCQVINAGLYAIHLRDEWAGSTQQWRIERFNGGAVGGSGIGIFIDGTSGTGYINDYSGSGPVAGIRVNGGSVVLSNIHIESTVIGIDFQSGGMAINVVGHPTITDLIKISAGGGVLLMHINKNGGTNLINDTSVTPALVITDGGILFYSRSGDGGRQLIHAGSDTVGSAWRVNDPIGGTIDTFANADATPSVAAKRAYKTGNAAPASITSLDDGAIGQEVTIIGADGGNTTMVDGGNLVLAGNFVLGNGDTITLIFDGTNWNETGRSNN